MGPSGLSSMAMNPTRAAGMTPLYAGQRLPQHGYPGPPQAQPLPRQGVKRAYSEVSVLVAQFPVLGTDSPPSCPQSYKNCLSRGLGSPPSQHMGSCFPLIPLFSRPGRFPLLQVYPGQQYLQGGQYAPSTAQYAPGPGQPPAPSPSYPGHRLPLQQGIGQSLSAPGPTGLHYKVGLAPLSLC